MTEPELTIAGRIIGAGEPPYIVAELSCNHGGEIGRAFEVMEAARDAGADAVKLQTYTADTMTIDHNSEEFLLSSGPSAGLNLYQLYEQAHTPWDWHERLFTKGRELGITVFSSPFDATAVDLLEQLEAPAYKIASFELVDLPLIERVAGAGRPMIMSTGMANLAEIEDAVFTARKAGARDILLTHCVSGYPTPFEECNLRTLTDLAESLDVLVGLSDHTLGTAAAVAAVALGASLIEKHVIMSRREGGPDSAFSIEPDELARLVQDCGDAWRSLGRVSYEVQPSESERVRRRRSIYVVADIAKGDSLTSQNVRCIRPGLGLPPKYLPEVLGRTALVPLNRGTPLRLEDIEG